MVAVKATAAKTGEQALGENTNYAVVFADKPRFIPIIGFRKIANTPQ